MRALAAALEAFVALAFRARALRAASEALVAISRLCSAVIFVKRALPPRRPISDITFEMIDLFMDLNYITDLSV
jgi:hypothetical protein